MLDCNNLSARTILSDALRAKIVRPYGTRDMPTDYDGIAESYVLAKSHPWRAYVERHCLAKIIGDARGLNVLDLACGDGFNTRWLKGLGTARTVGVDLSRKMVELAKARENEARQGIEYLVADAKELPDLGQFDLIVAGYLLNYARGAQELQAMLGGISRSLVPGGRFVAANANPFLNFAAAPDYSPYGFLASSPSPMSEGSPIRWTFLLESGPIEVENYHHAPATHEAAFVQSGLCGLRWHQPEVSQAGLEARGPEYWRTFVEHPPVIFLNCERCP